MAITFNILLKNFHYHKNIALEDTCQHLIEA